MCHRGIHDAVHLIAEKRLRSVSFGAQVPASIDQHQHVAGLGGGRLRAMNHLHRVWGRRDEIADHSDDAGVGRSQRAR